MNRCNAVYHEEILFGPVLLKQLTIRRLTIKPLDYWTIGLLYGGMAEWRNGG